MDNDLAPLVQALVAVKPYLADIVLVGGWVPILYGKFTTTFKAETIRTADIDFACPSYIALREESIDQMLQRAGFEARLSGSTTVPCCKYVKDVDVEIEFLTPLKGDGSQLVEKIQQGLTAETLRYLDVLLSHVDRIRIEEDLVVRVPLISAFLFQKGLSFRDRRNVAKKRKDLYYIYKVVRSVDEERLIKELTTVSAAHPRKWTATFLKNLEMAFESEDSEGALSVVEQLMEIPGEQNDQDVLRMQVFVTVSDFLIAMKSRMA